VRQVVISTQEKREIRTAFQLYKGRERGKTAGGMLCRLEIPAISLNPQKQPKNAPVEKKVKKEV
jgi:hypothetical protein